MRNGLLLSFLGAVLISLSTNAKAQSVEEFYRGKIVTFMTGDDAGATYDTWSRLIARHMGKHLPGHPTFIVQNKPGGGHIVATNHLFHIAHKDGTVIGMISRNMPNTALMNRESVQFDPAAFNWIGSPELTNRVCVAVEGAPVQKAGDLFEKELLIGGSGAGTAVSTTPVILRNLLGMKFKLIEGYQSPPEVFLAMQRGEVQGICQTMTGIEQGWPGAIASGKLKVLFNTERTPIASLGAPSVFELVKTEEQRQILSLYTSSVELGRPILAPPGVPEDRVAALRQAFLDTMADPELRADAERQGLEINVLKGEQVSSIVSGVMATDAAIVEKMKRMSR